MSREIHPADPRLRRTTLAALSGAVLAAVLVTLGFRHWLAGAADLMSIEQLIAVVRQLTGALTMIGGACVLVLALHALRVAAGVSRQQRWPRAEARTLRDVPVRRGAGALRIAAATRIGAVLLIALAVGAALSAWRLLGFPGP